MENVGRAGWWCGGCRVDRDWDKGRRALRTAGEGETGTIIGRAMVEGLWRREGREMAANGWGGEEGGGGAAVWMWRRRRRPEAAAAAAAAAEELHDVDPGTKQGEAAASAAGTVAARRGAAAVAEAAVGLPPCSSLSSLLRGESLLFFK